MRNVLVFAALATLGSPAWAESGTPPPARLSPFVEFTGQQHTLRSVASPGNTLQQPRKPNFEVVVRTPTTRFADIRRHSPGALYECTIPETLRGEPFLPRP
jgi:hypothetical protein